MTRIYALRHGETPLNLDRRIIGGRSNHSLLTERGEREALLAGPVLKSLGVFPDIVYATTALRTQQTLELVLQAYDVKPEPIISDAFAEMSQGLFEGKSRSKVYTPRKIPLIKRQLLDFKLPGAESMNEVADRVLSKFDEIADLHQDQTVLVVMHGVAITCAFGRALGWNHAQIRKSVENLSLSEMQIHDGVRRAMYVGRNIIGDLAT